MSDQAARASELDELRRQLAEAKRLADSNAALAAKARAEHFEAEAKAFYREMFAASKCTPGEKQTILDAFMLAVSDDLEHPIAGQPTARRESLRRAFEGRTPHILTRELVAADPSQRTRALAADPAASDVEGRP